MKKVVIRSLKNKELMMENINRLTEDESIYDIFKLYDKYYMKDLSHTHGLNILLFEVVGDELFIDKLPISKYINIQNDNMMLARIILLSNFLSILEAEKVSIQGKIRKSESKMYKKQLKSNDIVIIDNIEYVESVNKNSKYEWNIDNFNVRQHIRHLKDGSKIIVKGYKKIVDKCRLSMV